MQEYYPNYYADFRCLASSCLHSCCKGWEIDVDEFSLMRYEDFPDIKEHIKDGCFILTEDERCPFLRDDGLCDMILKYGEDILCDICNDHPRFRNYSEDGESVDIGLGLCCEAAASLILDAKEPFALVPPRTLPEIFDILSDRKITFEDKISALSSDVWDHVKRADVFLSLERLDPLWDEMLLKIKESEIVPDKEIDEKTALRLSNLASYILFRHGAGNKRLMRLAAECTLLIKELTDTGYDIFECARMFSAEVEYSDINVDILLKRIGE